jgi:DNA polymerase-3 subunit alpha
MRACRKYGIVPLMGVEAYFRPNRLERNKGEKAYHQILIAKNIQGWHNLIRLTTIAQRHQSQGGGFYRRPCVDWEIIEKYSDGLICTTACVGSYLSHLVQDGDDGKIREFLNRLKSIYGDNLFLEIQPHDMSLQREYNIAVVRLAREYSLAIVATGDVHYPYEGWGSTQEILKLLNTNNSFAKREEDLRKKAEGKFRRDDDADTAAAERRSQGEDVFTKEIPTLYLMSEDEMRQGFNQWHPNIDQAIVDESISNTNLVASRCAPFLIDRSVKAPKVTRGPEEAEQILRGWIEEGLAKRFSQEPAVTDERQYLDRIEFELDVLRNRGVFDYFVLFGRWLRWMASTEPLPGEEGEKEPIETGAGRGSVGGSLVAYLIGLTKVDPIPYGMRFERFLNPERKGLPDIDQDIGTDRRQYAKQWFSAAVGPERVAQVIAYDTFSAKSAIKDVARVCDVPYAEANEITKTYEVTVFSNETTLEQIKEVNSDLQQFASKYPKVFHEACRLEGQKQGISQHAAAVVVADRDLDEFLPRQKPQKVPSDVAWPLLTSFDGDAEFNAIEEIGLVKLDALAIKPPTEFAYARRLLKGELDLDLPALRDPYAVDTDVMEAFQIGDTIGIFQFSTPEMTQLVKKIKPTNMFDLAACNALVRPGANKMEDEFKQRKENSELVDYWTPELEPILKINYGLMIYQEDLMDIVQMLGGFTKGQADDMRKAIAKYYRLGKAEAQRRMHAFYAQWAKGTEERGIPSDKRDLIWDRILAFGGYGFNKSHAVAYSATAYLQQWLKVRHPEVFYAAHLTFQDKQERRMVAINAAKSRGVKFLPPEMGLSEEGFKLTDEGLRFGFEAVRGIGRVAAKKLCNVHGWADLDAVREDFKKNEFEALEECGALDKLGGRKGWDEDKKAQLERERLGMALSGRTIIERWGDVIESRAGWVSKEEYAQLPAGPRWAKNGDGSVTVGGEILGLQVRKVKNGRNRGKDWATFQIAYGLDTYNCKMFSDVYEDCGDVLAQRPPAVLVHGRKSDDGPDAELTVDKMASVTVVEKLEQERMAPDG